MALAERATPGAILAAGATATIAALLLTLPATGVADAALVALGAALAAGTGLAWRESKRLAALPLELSRVAATGVVDGAVVYRFRARLGHGRAFRDPVARVTWEPEGGAPIPLATGPLPASACGPLTLIVRDDEGRIGTAGTFRLELRVASAGRGWSAEGVVARSAVVRGRFDGLRVTGGRLSFAEEWDALLPEAPGTSS